MLVIIIRAFILYIIVIFSIRLMGKRQLGELQPSELVITILVSNIATLPIENSDIPMFTGIVPILTLVCLDVIMSAISLKNRFIRKIVSGSPKIIIRDGIIDQNAMKAIRFSIEDLLEALRQLNIFDISEVQFAIVETTGSISVYQKYDYRPATPEVMEIKGRSIDPPQLVIDDGKLIETSLDYLKFGKGWLESVLNENKVTVKDVFLMTVDPDGKYNIVRKKD